MSKNKDGPKPPKSLQDFVNGDHPMGRLTKMSLEDTVSALQDLAVSDQIQQEEEWETHETLTGNIMQPMGITKICVHKRGSAISFNARIPLPAVGVSSALGSNHLSAESAGYFQSNLTDLKELENAPTGSRLFYRQESDYGKGQKNWGNFGPFSACRDYCYASHQSHTLKPEVFRVSLFSVSGCNSPSPKGVVRGRFVFLFQIQPTGPWTCDLQATAVNNFGGRKQVDKAEMMRIPYTWYKAFTGQLFEPSQLTALPSVKGLDVAKPLSQQPKGVVLEQIKQRFSTTRQLLELPLEQSREVKFENADGAIAVRTHTLPLAGGTAVQSEWSVCGLSPEQACAALTSPAFLNKNSFAPLTRPPSEKAYLAPVKLFGDHSFQVILQRQGPTEGEKAGIELDQPGPDSLLSGNIIQSLMVQCFVFSAGKNVQLFSMPLSAEGLKAMIAASPEPAGHSKHPSFTSLAGLLERLERQKSSSKDNLVGSYTAVEFVGTDYGTKIRHVVVPDNAVRNSDSQIIEISSAYVEQITGAVAAVKMVGYQQDKIPFDQMFDGITRAWSALFPACPCTASKSVGRHSQAAW